VTYSDDESYKSSFIFVDRIISNLNNKIVGIFISKITRLACMHTVLSYLYIVR